MKQIYRTLNPEQPEHSSSSHLEVVYLKTTLTNLFCYANSLSKHKTKNYVHVHTNSKQIEQEGPGRSDFEANF